MLLYHKVFRFRFSKEETALNLKRIRQNSVFEYHKIADLGERLINLSSRNEPGLFQDLVFAKSEYLKYLETSVDQSVLLFMRHR